MSEEIKKEIKHSLENLMQYYDQEFPYNTTKRLQSILTRLQQQVKVEPEVKVNFAEIEKELNNYAEEKNGRIMDNADACDHLQSKLNYINDNFYLIRK